MNARLKTVKLPEGRRIVAVSDLHGNLDGFRALLKQLAFSKDDILIINGDILEKGPDSLGLLRCIIRLSKTHTVYEVCGNCDDFYDEIANIDTPEQNQELLDYMLNRKHSVLNEMCAEIGLQVSSKTDMHEMKSKLRSSFQEEFQYLATLPDILDTQRFTFVHAALQPGTLETQDREFCLSTGNFRNLGYQFEKPCVVGHWPVSLYGKSICHNPIFDRESNIFSIDGGNVLKMGGQINAMILPDITAEAVTFQYFDGLPKAVALDNSAGTSENSVRFYWTDGKVERIKSEGDYSFCRHTATGNEVWVPNSWLFTQNGELHTDDYTDECLAVCQGETVSVVETTSRGHFIKKNGSCGWYYGRLAMQQEEES